MTDIIRKFLNLPIKVKLQLILYPLFIVINIPFEFILGSINVVQKIKKNFKKILHFANLNFRESMLLEIILRALIFANHPKLNIKTSNINLFSM